MQFEIARYCACGACITTSCNSIEDWHSGNDIPLLSFKAVICEGRTTRVLEGSLPTIRLHCDENILPFPSLSKLAKDLLNLHLIVSDGHDRTEEGVCLNLAIGMKEMRNSRTRKLQPTRVLTLLIQQLAKPCPAVVFAKPM